MHDAEQFVNFGGNVAEMKNDELMMTSLISLMERLKPINNTQAFTDSILIDEMMLRITHRKQQP